MPTGSHLISWPAYRSVHLAQLSDKCERALPHKWYLNIRANTTIPDSNDQLYDQYVCSPLITPTVTLLPGVSTSRTNRKWIVTLDDDGVPLFGKQLSVQSAKNICVIVHWISDCLSSPSDLICLRPCLGCAAHTLFLRLPLDTTEIISSHFWADLSNSVTSYYHRLYISPNFSLSPSTVDCPSAEVQIVHDAGYLNSVTTYACGTIQDWPFSSCAEAAAIFATLAVTPTDSMTHNFELWASIERSIRRKWLTVLSVKVKGHDGNYWNKFANSLANSAHLSDDATSLSVDNYTFSHDIRLVYDDIVCETNPQRLLKQHYYSTCMMDLLLLKRFQFTFLFRDNDNYVIDWELTWFTLLFSPVYDASFNAQHACRHYSFKFKLFLDDLPLLEKLKITCPDLYIDFLTCRSCRDHKEDLMHLILCSKHRDAMHQILQSYQNYLFSKLNEACELIKVDPTPSLAKLSFLSCWNFSPSNWSSYVLISGCLPKIFVNLFVNLSIPRPSAIKVVVAIHNHFIH
ncbi:hypothetical protein RclHR1_01220014 [Rhizophagus clarus]|uniref:RNase H type-1 domain-containing protein n=1 Tax=Rhizophagus clarus TaxID=94130 RepID=A0A2Z6QYG4_9GLOM|nr:hypothetical protein RclHR1_01220014 [Rhizophagus clarus]